MSWKGTGKAVQRKTTRWVQWLVPTKKELMGGARVYLFKVVPYLEEIEHQEVARGSDSAESFIVHGSGHYTTRHYTTKLDVRTCVPPNPADLPPQRQGAIIL